MVVPDPIGIFRRYVIAYDLPSGENVDDDAVYANVDDAIVLAAAADAASAAEEQVREN